MPSHWELESGEFEESEVPDAIRRLVDPSGAYSLPIRTYDGSTIGYKNNEEEDLDDAYNSVDDNAENFPPSTTVGNAMAVQDMSLTCLRSMLIEHFNANFRNNKVTWPTRLAKKPRPVATSTSPFKL